MGLVVYSERTGLTYHRLQNVHPEPMEHFAADPLAVHEIVSAPGAQLHGVHHSHPKADDRSGRGLCPSFADMETQMAWAVPFYITALSPRGTYMDFFGWGDQLPYPSLKQRQFRSGVADCYALVRHLHYALDGTVYPDGPRSLLWWDDPSGAGSNPLTDQLTGKGFIEVPAEDIQPGDDLLFAIRRGAIVHCGTYLGNDLFLHHLHGRLSKVDPLPMWGRFLAKVVRYAPGDTD